MPTTGEQTPAAWTEEFQRNGRVVFPLRRRPYVLRGAVILFVYGLSGVSNLISLADQSGYRLLATSLRVMLLLTLIGIGSWQLITRWPILTVDAEGIRYGRAFMAWDEVGTAGIPRGPAFFRTLPVLPANVWDKEIRIHRDNVRDLTALSAWLNDLRPHRKHNDKEPHADNG
ncbi:hypothetical protein E1263_41490 [Kribbella antibiotica]|uniref:PH domain-containing protein n=1 Tax=Kribbella antibiotica TaxID=190195 RepID=A0A4V2YKP5_9ACTN|nr:hypothetical protein [Kribbella antibiotica]TDD43677.1 hypothetical protein E1263_41490 [Kribbella antibiotica]